MIYAARTTPNILKTVRFLLAFCILACLSVRHTQAMEYSLPDIVKETVRLYFNKPCSYQTSSIKTHLAHLRTNRAISQNDLPLLNNTTSREKDTARSWQEFAKSFQDNKAFQKPQGVFVTLSIEGKTRACWGTVFPQYNNLAEAVVWATLGALNKEYRYRPIRASELELLKPQVTVVKSVESVSSVKSINPWQDGLMVRSGGKSGIILPGEAQDAYYELVLGKLKASIKPGEPYQLYRIKTQIYD